MFRVAIIACIVPSLLAAPFSAELNGEWEAFKTSYRKSYDVNTEGLRRLIWEKNLKYIRQHNLEADRGVHTYWLGENEFADMTNEEFVATMNGYKHNVTGVSRCGQYMPPLNVELKDLPDTVDWRDKGYVTPIKNQGRCGSCWSFSTTGSLEGQHFRKTGDLVSLSEKNLMDCSMAEGNHGCKGGLMDQAFAYVIKNNGIDTESSYPYEPIDGPCRFKEQNVGATEDSCKDIRHQSEDQLQQAVANEGPISVAIDAGHSSFQLYKRGVYYEPRCSSVRLDHGVLAVGYGTNMGEDYWLVKNSWGTTWGNEGYIMMSRNKNNNCGVATQASFPTV